MKRSGIVFSLVCMLAIMSIAQTSAFGQNQKNGATKLPNNKAKKAPVKLPAPENVFLETSDRVKLKVTYFAPAISEAEGGAKAAPVILLHDWEGNRGQLLQYGAFLQKKGHAVIVPDLRGHGESTHVTGLAKQIDAKKFRKNEIITVQKDIERCKKYLVRRNNKGEVNIDLLSVVAVGKTSVLAVQWVLNDWFAYTSHNADGIKQGQDVKALVLISPEKTLKGVSMMGNINHPLYTGVGGAPIPLLIVWADGDGDSAKDSESMFAMLKKSRPDVSKIEDPAKRDLATTLYGVPVENQSHTGEAMMDRPIVNGLWPYTQKMFALKVIANQKSFPWASREKKKDDE